MGLSVEGLSWRSKLLRSEVSAVSAAVRVSLTQLTYIQDTELSSGSVWLRCQRHKIHGDINKQYTGRYLVNTPGVIGMQPLKE